MISLLLIVFLLQVAIHVFTLLGSEAISGLIWQIYCKLPTPHSRKEAANAVLRPEVVALAREMNNTSAQDDFARWAKLRRQHDKKKDEYDKNAREVQDFQASFNRAAGIVKWISTNGVRYAVQWWFGKQAMFWLPKGWVPYPVEWILSFPSAPLGAVSIGMWWTACAGMISMVSEVLIAAWKLSQSQSKSPQGEKLKMGAQSSRIDSPAVKISEKKEL